MPYALCSVFNKEGLRELADGLVALDYTILASGETARFLRSVSIKVQDVASFTGSPEVLGGRVKTLHPAIHAGILARDTVSDLRDLEILHSVPIDVVVVNLYPFESTIQKPGVTLDEAIENIDIGGVALIRGAAKNHARVSVLIDPGDYQKFLKELADGGTITEKTRYALAVKAFRHTSDYDRRIFQYLASTGKKDAAQGFENRPESRIALPDFLSGLPTTELRYGENPHQEACLLSLGKENHPLGGEILQGKALSYNNLLDLDAAFRLICSFSKPSACVVKHNSPCGIASDASCAAALVSAIKTDKISAFGSVIAINEVFDIQVVHAMGDLFVECIIAPGYTQEALDILGKKKNLRLIKMGDMVVSPKYEIRSINQGLLVQEVDLGDPAENVPWTIITKRQPTEEEMEGLIFAWKACQHVRSNAIVFTRGERTIGIGGGQPNRVDSVRIAIKRAGEEVKGAVMASDAFFPFSDSVQEAAAAGITAIIQPGGSIRDEESIALANELNMAMVFTHVRHFRH